MLAMCACACARVPVCECGAGVCVRETVCIITCREMSRGWNEGEGRDTDVTRWHVPSGGFGVVVILLFVWFSPPSPHYSNNSHKLFK